MNLANQAKLDKGKPYPLALCPKHGERMIVNLMDWVGYGLMIDNTYRVAEISVGLDCGCVVHIESLR